MKRVGVALLAMTVCLGGGTLWADDMDEEDQETIVEKTQYELGKIDLLSTLQMQARVIGARTVWSTFATIG